MRVKRTRTRGAKPLQTGALSCGASEVHQGGACLTKGGCLRTHTHTEREKEHARLQPQQPRIAAQRGLAVPHLWGCRCSCSPHQNWHVGTCQVPCRRYCEMGKDGRGPTGWDWESQQETEGSMETREASKGRGGEKMPRNTYLGFLDCYVLT